MSVLRVAIYPRISFDRKGERLGSDRQIKAARAIAAGLGPCEIVVYPKDASLPASKPRPASSDYARLIADVRAGKIHVVIVWDLDRLTRIPREIEDWLDLAAEGRGVRIITMDGECDTASANGRMFMRIKAAVMRHEIEHKAARQRAASDQRAERGLPVAGKRTFGFTPDGMGHAAGEADRVREAYAWTLAGVPLRGILRRWAAAGVRTSTGAAWEKKGLRDLLTRPAYAGLREHRGVIVGAAAWPAIVDEDTWRAVQTVLADPARATGPGNARKWLLPGIAVCGYDGCGARLTTGANRPGVRTLKCPAGRHLERRAEPIEAYVIAHVFARLLELDAADLLAPVPPDLAPLRARSAALRKQRKVLAADLDVDLDFAKARDRRLAAELREIDVALSAAAEHTTLSKFAGRDPAVVWRDLDLDGRRATVAALMDVVVVAVGRSGPRKVDGRTVIVTPRPRG